MVFEISAHAGHACSAPLGADVQREWSGETTSLAVVKGRSAWDSRIWFRLQGCVSARVRHVGCDGWCRSELLQSETDIGSGVDMAKGSLVVPKLKDVIDRILLDLRLSRRLSKR